MKNILKKWQKEAKKKNKNKYQWGWFVNPDAGNVEYNNAFFNHVTGADGGDTGLLVSAAAGGEGLGESMKQETVTLYYKDIEVDGGYGPLDWETGVPKYEYHETIDYEYKVDRDDIFEELWEIELETPSEVSKGEFMSEEELESYIDSNFYELVEKHYDKLLEIFRERAEEQANEEYEYDAYQYMESIDLVEALNRIDAKTFNKFDLVNSYHAASLTEAKKQELANLIKKGANALKLAEFFDDNSDWQIGLELFADNGKEYKVVSVLDTREVGGYELSVVGALGNEASNADDEVYFVLLDSDVEGGPVDTADEAIEWSRVIEDGYYKEKSKLEYYDSYGLKQSSDEVEENLITEDWKDAYRYHVVTMMPPKFKNILQGGSNDFDSAERIAIDAMKRYASNPWEDDDRKIEAIENMLIIDRNADPDSKDYAQVTLRMEKVMDRLVDKIDPTDGLRESAMSELDVEIQSAGGLDAWIKDTKEKLKRSSKNLYFLNTQARREINAGGAFDSVEELEDAIEAEQREYNELKDKYDFVASSAMDNIRSNKLMNNFNNVPSSSRYSWKLIESRITVDDLPKSGEKVKYRIVDDYNPREIFYGYIYQADGSNWREDKGFFFDDAGNISNPGHANTAEDMVRLLNKNRAILIKDESKAYKNNESKLTEYVQLKIDPKEMIDDIDTIYYHSGDTDAIEKILSRNGSDPSKDDWTIGLDIPSAYADVIEYAKKRYPDPDYDELPYAIGEIIYPEVFNEGYQESKLTESSMSRSEMIDWIEDNWNTTEGYKQLDAAIEAIGYDTEHLDDSDREEGMYANFSTEDLENIMSVLKSGRTKDGYDTSVKPQRIPMTDSRAKDTFKLALDNLGRATEIDKGVSSALAMYRVMIDGKEYQVQIYKMD